MIARGDMARASGRPGRTLCAVWSACLVVLAVLACALGGGAPAAAAVKAVAIANDQDMVEVTQHAELLGSRGDSIQVETAPDSEGMVGRMSVRASAQGVSPNWLVFALRNTTDRPIERWVTSERYSVIGSGIVWPDLDTRRIEAVTPSLGFLPERMRSDRADIFRITLEAGQTVTYVAELASDRFARIYVWKPVEYELKARDRQLYNGILLGITGVLGIFLTAVFVANHKPIFPSAALVTWCVLAYLCVDFGFWHKLFQLRPEDNAVYRAATEAAMAASILVFLYIFLRLSASPSLARMLLAVWMIVQIALVGLAVIDARLAATFARSSFALIGIGGMLATLYLALRGQDRALSLLPTWILFLVWIFAASVTLTGRLSGDAVVSSLSGGLVLITVLMGFTVTQFAFRSLDTSAGAAPAEQHVRSMAIDGAGASLWEWNVRRDEVKTGPLIEASLGLNAGELSATSEQFCTHLHAADRERLKLLLWSVKESGGGEIRLELRMLHADNSYRWFSLEAAALPAQDRRALRCVGLMREITEVKRAQERLLHDAVHDSLTGLPNRQLFLDRLGVAVKRARNEPMVMPGVVLIDVDKFRSINAAYGLVVGDSLLLTLARRLQHHLGAQDTLARLGGNQFAVMLMQAHDPSEVAALAESIRRAVRAPIKIAGQDVTLTAALGIAIWDQKIATADALLEDAEVAMYRAKRNGNDAVEAFRPEMRSEADNRVALESELRAAVERQELVVLYQPIVALATEELAGYEALVRWQHPRLGMLGANDFIPIAEESDLIVKLGSQVLTRAVEDAAEWQKHLPRGDRPLFVSVNISSRQLFRADLVQEIRQVIGRTLVPAGALRLELTETLVMENPERAVEVLDLLRSAGAGLSLDDFGTGYSSLAYLNRFPFDTVKIDRDLVQASTTAGSGAAIVRSIVALSHELGKKVVAEGVELQSDVAFLRSIGCELAQGYYYGEPMTQREVERMLRQIRKNERRLQRAGFFVGKGKGRDKPRPTAAAGAPPPDKPKAGGAAVVPPADGAFHQSASPPFEPLYESPADLPPMAPGHYQAPPAAPAYNAQADTYNGHANGMTPPPYDNGYPPGPPMEQPAAWSPAAAPHAENGGYPPEPLVGPLAGLAEILAASPQAEASAAPPPGSGPVEPFADFGQPYGAPANGHGSAGTPGYDDANRHPSTAPTSPANGALPHVNGGPTPPHLVPSEQVPPTAPSRPSRPSRIASSAKPDLTNLPPAIAQSLARLNRGGSGTGGGRDSG